jgi:hypothetical protein
MHISARAVASGTAAGVTATVSRYAGARRELCRRGSKDAAASGYFRFTK